MWTTQTEHYLDSLRIALNNDSVFYEEGGDYAAFKRYYSNNAPALSGYTSIANHSQQLHNYYVAHPLNGGLTSRAAQANNDAWEELGPKKANNFAPSKSNIGPTECIAISEFDPQRMLVASLSGGLFASTDGGEHWSNAGSDSQWERIGCQYAQFSPTNADYWFACNGFGLGYTGALYRTANAGATWESIGNHTSLNFDNTLYNFRINPINADVIYLASAFGLYKTTNATTPIASNVTWTKLAIPIPMAVSTYMSSNNIIPI